MKTYDELKADEVWEPIKGYEGIYELNRLGQIKRLPCSVKRGANGNLPIKERLLSGSIQKHGYFTVILSRDGKKDKRYLHRLIAEHFIQNGENKPTVNHINGIKTDNRIENLEWATYQENNVHAFDTGLNSTIGARLAGKKGELCHNHKNYKNGN